MQKRSWIFLLASFGLSLSFAISCSTPTKDQAASSGVARGVAAQDSYIAQLHNGGTEDQGFLKAKELFDKMF